jgi:[glutamine synthetase] adenylyltransferase / [glutamine synthetase]-adenylyl-L-tyrosine phosphorylase
MDILTLRKYLDHPEAAEPWLKSLGLVDLKRAHGNILAMAMAGIPLDLLAVICCQIRDHLPGCADPDMALNNLERFIRAARNPLGMGTFFQRDPDALPTLLQILSTSQHLSDLLVTDPEGFDLLRLTEGASMAREALVNDITAEVAALEHDQAVLRALRRFKRRETLRIAYGDIVREQSLQTVTKQISFLADAVLEAALRAAGRKIGVQRGTPLGPDGQPARFTVMGMGKLGGLELNYSSDIDLIFLYDHDGKTDGRRPITNLEFFDQLAREFVRLITERTELGSVYRVDLRLRPEGEHGPMVMSIDSAMNYYDMRGRTWERQAYIKARPVAGSLELGDEFLERLTPWIYRRYLTATDIAGIKALKRRIEQHTHHAGADDRDVKTGHGGIRDVEFVIQFLQLLNGGSLPELRTANTLEALARLEEVGCLTNLERSLLVENYSFLRKVEHRLQIMLDLQTHLLPQDNAELGKLALRMGYANKADKSALEAFAADYRGKTQLNRKILDHLLHDAFDQDEKTSAEVDLVLDPDPPEERILEVLGKYPFRDLKSAYRNLMALGEEKIRFLSTRRCRHFLAAIAPQLLAAIAETADPDSTLVNLGVVSDSLGSKGVLWELFSFNPPSLSLYVELCAYSPYLSGILTSNPGMIDSLMDSLVMDKLPGQHWLEKTLGDLCWAAEDIEPILHSFKNDQQLCVGVRDILGKEDVQAITGTLSNIAQTCMKQIAEHEYNRLAARFGAPLIGAGRRTGKPCEWVVLGMGKFGGREMNYHSDLDIVFLYEADGHTSAEPGQAARQSTTNQHFFSELGQRIIKTASQLSALGRLYEVDARLRPTGKSGALTTTFKEFVRYFVEGGGQLWERQALCKARVIFGSQRAERLAESAIAKATFSRRWRHTDAEEIRNMRRRMEETASAGDLKRGPGGIVDIEFLVQMLQLKYGRNNLNLREPNTLAALHTLYLGGMLSVDDYEMLDASYRLLRTIEGRLRLMNSTARDRLPQDPTELAKLAHILYYPGSDGLMMDFENATRQVRRRFEQIFEEEGKKTRKVE